MYGNRGITFQGEKNSGGVIYVGASGKMGEIKSSGTYPPSPDVGQWATFRQTCPGPFQGACWVKQPKGAKDSPCLFCIKRGRPHHYEQAEGRLSRKGGGANSGKPMWVGTDIWGGIRVVSLVDDPPTRARATSWGTGAVAAER